MAPFEQGDFGLYVRTKVGPDSVRPPLRWNWNKVSITPGRVFVVGILVDRADDEGQQASRMGQEMHGGTIGAAA
jgi:hypothetical protein